MMTILAEARIAVADATTIDSVGRVAAWTGADLTAWTVAEGIVGTVADSYGVHCAGKDKFNE